MENAPANDEGGKPASAPGASITATLLGLAVVAAIGWVDVVTGPDYGLSLFYLVPIVVAARTVGRAPAVVLAAAATVSWFLGDTALLTAPLTFASGWNTATRGVIYVTMGLLVSRLRRDRTELARANARLEEAFERERQLSRTDPLTGVSNLRHFLEELAREGARSRRNRTPLAVCSVDLDRFKAVNDRFGHAAGDELLLRTARLLRSSVRTVDLVARVGGDEFVVLLVELGERDARETAERILETLTDATAEYRSSVGFGASVGVAFFPVALEDLEAMLQRADAALYAAKAAGRGRVSVAT